MIGTRYGSMVFAAVVLIGCGGPASIEVAPKTPRLTRALSTMQLQVTVKDKSGKVLSEVPVGFRSLTPTLATIDTSGRVTAIKSGAATILISAGDVKKETTVLIQLAKKIAIDPDSPRLMLGVTRGFKATVLNDLGEPMLAGKVRWTSSNPAVFSVDADGNVKSLTEGVATLTAHAADIKGSTVITVRHEKLHEDGTLD